MKALSATAVGGGFLALALLATAGSMALGRTLHPAPMPGAAALLARVPEAFGRWQIVPGTAEPINPAQPDAQGRPGRVYDAIVSRTYAAPDGAQVMVMLAYQDRQYQEDRIHSPELCYYAQGFVLQDRQDVVVSLAGRARVPARAFHGASLHRHEDVVYWIRTGNALRADALATRFEIFNAALHGRIDDGLLVRVSMTDDLGPPMSALARRRLLVRFLQDFFAASPVPVRLALAGYEGT